MPSAAFLASRDLQILHQLFHEGKMKDFVMKQEEFGVPLKYFIFYLRLLHAVITQFQSLTVRLHQTPLVFLV